MSDTIEAPLAPLPDHLRHALLESRQRWREFGAIAADVVFETDIEGRLTFLSPGVVLGWPSLHLLGQPAAELLAEQREGVPDPFRFALSMHRCRTWVRQADGTEVCLAITSAPLMDEIGRRIGMRGVGVDVTERERRDAQVAAALRRAEVLDHILSQMRQEVLAPRMMQSVLDSVLRALGGRSAAVLDLTQAPELSSALHSAGLPVEEGLPELLALVRGHGTEPQAEFLLDGKQALACQASTRFGDQAALIVLRDASERPWDEDDRTLIASITGVVRIVLEHESIQRELARQARTDPLTGLLNRRAFLDEASRRIDRLDRDGAPGTLIFIDLDRLKPLNDRLGHEAGDAALVLTAAMLRNAVRPADLVARLGGDEFALWLDGSDQLTAAERAEELRLTYPRQMAHFTEGEEAGMSMSIGIACREPGSAEELDRLIQRADQAMYEVKRAGRGHWRVSPAERLS